MSDQTQPVFPGMTINYRNAHGVEICTPTRGKHYVEPRGYAAKPGTGPAGETCGSCRHKTRKGTGNRSFPACALTRSCWTSTRRTDILARAAACSKWEAR